MLRRKVEKFLLEWKETSNKALLVTGARQIGKSFIIREFGKSHYRSYVEFNLLEDERVKRVLAEATDATDLINRITLLAETLLIEHDALVFIDEIQELPDIMTMAKFLVEDGRFSYAFSGSMLGTEFKGVRSYPVGYVHELTMRPLDFEEYCWALNVPQLVLDDVRDALVERRPLENYVHDSLMRNFRTYLIVGGMPEVVQRYLEDGYSLNRVRSLQGELVVQYRHDIEKYAGPAALRVRDIFDQIPLQLEEPNSRFVVSSLGEDARYERYKKDFLWLVNAGVALKVEQVSEAKSPLKRTELPSKFKLYQSDTGMLLSRYPQSTARAIYLDERAPNLGGVYENVIAQELAAQGIVPYYYMDESRNEVDFLIEGKRGRVVPVEVKSGRKFRNHAAINNMLANKASRAQEGIVLCRSNIEIDGKITYVPFYASFCMSELTEAGEADFVMHPATW